MPDAAPLAEIPIEQIASMNGGLVVKEVDRVRIVTDPRQWAYSANIDYEIPGITGSPRLLVVSSEIHEGVLGIGWLSQDGRSWITRSSCGRNGPSEIRLVIPAGTVGGRLIFDNWTAAGGAARGCIDRIRIYDATLLNDSGEEVPEALQAREPAHSESTTFATEAKLDFDPVLSPEQNAQPTRLVRANDGDYSLRAVTEAPFIPRAQRDMPFAMGGITTTEVCNLSCVMCHFNGPKAAKKSRQLSHDDVVKMLRQIPPGQVVWFAGTGDLFMDSGALDHLRASVSTGHQPAILTHGQLLTAPLLDELLEIGVRLIRISADAIDHHHYGKIRRGGDFGRILEACSYLRSKKRDYPDLVVEVSCTLFGNTAAREAEFATFWSDKVDRVLFNAEYYNTFLFRSVFRRPSRRVNCKISTYVVPSGQIAPCCAMVVHQHDQELAWLPHIDTHSLKEAYDILCDMYDDTTSPLGELCKKCDWWILHSTDGDDGGSAYFRQHDFDK